MNCVTITDSLSGETRELRDSLLTSLEVERDGYRTRVFKRDWDGRKREIDVPATAWVETQSDDGCGCWLPLLLFAVVIAAVWVCGGGGPLG